MLTNMTNHKDFATPQEEFWAGSFGTDYISRNDGKELLGSNLAFFVNALKLAPQIESCLELGANIGKNLEALQLLYPAIQLKGVEINHDAAKQLAELIGPSNVFEGSIFDYPLVDKVDLVLIKTVLIHINPEMLDIIYENLYQASSRYILICEYYNTQPVAISYRGHNDRLFKRDFAGEMLDKYTDLTLVDCGFAYHRVPPFMNDDITWFLLEKRS
jgi:pseudaminic acid biosynthesis-associated methylase